MSPGSARIPVDEIDQAIEERLVARLHDQVSERKAAETRYREEEVRRTTMALRVAQLSASVTGSELLTQDGHT